MSRRVLPESTKKSSNTFLEYDPPIVEIHGVQCILFMELLRKKIESIDITILLLQLKHTLCKTKIGLHPIFNTSFISIPKPCRMIFVESTKRFAQKYFDDGRLGTGDSKSWYHPQKAAILSLINLRFLEF